MTLAALRERHPLETRDIDGVATTMVHCRGSGTPILMLPGAQGGCEVFHKQLLEWGAKRPVVSVTYPSWPESERLAHWLAKLCDALGHASVDVVGSSFGGFVAQHFAALYPKLINRLVIGNSFHDPSTSQSAERLASAQRDGVIQKQEALKRLEAQPESELRSLLLELVGLQTAENLRSRVLGVQLSKPLPALNLSPDRLLLICSDNDPVVAAPVSKALQDHYPRSRQIVIAGGGHYPFVLNATDYNRAVGDFLGMH